MTSRTQISTRRRLTREARACQLLEAARSLIAEEGTDALTLGRLAEVGGVTKPVVYDHFGSRNGLLAALYQDYDVQQTELFDLAISHAAPNLQDKAQAFSEAYVRCVLSQGREMQDVLAALSGSPELAAVKRAYQKVLIGKCLDLFTPFAASGVLSIATLWAILGAADALAEAALAGEITQALAVEELRLTLLAGITRSQAPSHR
ncbi:TetR/AcrR family transcriptional regulator [Pseudomonas fulva]|uniref:TetR/AcrR family transcriptional regulator n=1 Tax=Pseudomonas fulva TaxID=47880 RepID=UPI0018AA1EAD|nr:TetR/AcrR family transcriptional regulator [Pseudomonas fulva]MBF8674369.1 TetR/AcrR family transcriptional regulator [Pseudomonas fulva]MBF8696028.1 TetR/AcrR family transcriptional regulator [Pseudomonas fulva]